MLCLTLVARLRQLPNLSDRHLSDQPIQPVEDIVRVVGIGGIEVSFLGYVIINIGFPKDEMGTEGPLKTLALVVPNNNYNQRVPVIIRINLVKQCMDECQRATRQRFLETVNISSKWKRVYQFIQSQGRFTYRHENGTVSEEGDDPSSLFDLDDTPLSTEQKGRTFALLKKMSHVFARYQNDLGCAEAVEHEIHLTDNVPSREFCRRVPPGQLDEFKEAVEKMLSSGVIRESKSPYASLVVLVRKKDGNLRVCVDFRKINSKTIRDAYPLPRISDTLEALQGARWFCSLDLQSGYLEVSIMRKDKPKTAMRTPFGLFEFNRVPFGLTNAPATF